MTIHSRARRRWRPAGSAVQHRTMSHALTSHDCDCYHVGVIRTQISLPADLMARAKQAAGARGISLAELVREALVQHLTHDDRQRRIDRAKRAVGGFRSGHPGLARGHDGALAEAERW
jgi:hypothetical protein